MATSDQSEHIAESESIPQDDILEKPTPKNDTFLERDVFK